MVRRALSPQNMGYAQADKRLQILQLVGEQGSISQAARTAGISYKAAWQAIHTLTNLAGMPLVDSAVGGSGGGGARLTPAGVRLLEAAHQMDVARRGVLERINAPSAAALAGPRTSMRNHLPCRVARLESDGARDPMVRVVLALADGGELASLITRESAELLALAPGLPVLALCKATAVRVASLTDVAARARGATVPVNRLAGKVARLSRGVQRDEAVVTLAGGLQLVGFAARPNRLRSGSRAVAELDESAVVVALTA
ncbi:LysR family transcriptional regulator [Ottowia sp. GY511]|uniref:TOBE domain-containing protein n=1 Tax=Ottowia flava TaxID=2675430 RepID=A0ABW4L165_9BURK|nr:TOBE domain-containing protein [Ottowia sp. GY511]TXK26273.1 LysR family transcriptional regulator [Ottowia sp. GY511]